jgi:hypothetical protein
LMARTRVEIQPNKGVSIDQITTQDLGGSAHCSVFPHLAAAFY